MDAVAARLADLVPADARTVFEMCRPGDSVARRVRLRNPVTSFAVLPLPAAGSPTDLPAPNLPDLLGPPRPRFDALLFHEAFLDLADPFAAMATALGHLRPGGPILLVLPYGWCERQRVERSSSSLITAIQAALEEGALQGSDLIVDAAARIFIPQPACDQPETSQPPAVSHLIVRAARKSEFRRLYVSAMTLRPAGACNDTRIDLPNAFLETVPGIRTKAAIEHVSNIARLAGEERIAILQRRICGPNDLPSLREIVREGYLLVSEFDDHPNHWPNMLKYGHLTFRAVHAVQTSTDLLARELSAYNPELAVFPNQIATLPPPRPPRTDGKTVLFFGAFNRGDDAHPLLAPLNRILAANPGRVGVQVVHDRAFFDALETDDKSFMPTCNYDGYIQALRRCDVGLLPLNDTLFNRSKSDLKYIECAAHGVVALASPVVYDETVRDGETGVLFRSPEDFADRLNRLIADTEWRAGIAERAYRYVRDNRLMAQHFRKRLDWYRSLLERKDELDARLFERVPALRL
ncbi:glycosyltransferase family protein [Azospirillum soli]|uniref:glycosyltransferase family protein n=1 Tax=Azospirillum soli TaxID=1304799 RepID=UPI001AE63076|nr:glycosyltransferase [Azospirillum soli]MBP2316542.1 hypothetical protein [Azospirillum soli]